MRDRGVKYIIDKAKVTAAQIGTDSDFPDKRKHKVKCMNFEEAKDEGQLFKPENELEHQFNSVLDSIITPSGGSRQWNSYQKTFNS